jgi:hypothetical protein
MFLYIFVNISFLRDTHNSVNVPPMPWVLVGEAAGA